MMTDVVAAVFGWGDCSQYVEFVKDRFHIDAIHVQKLDHEPRVLNHALSTISCRYIWILTPDVELYDPRTLNSLKEVLDGDDEIGVVAPNRERDPLVGGHTPYEKYLQDGTAILYRRSIGVLYDEEFIFTGWNDVDFGESIQAAGYKCYVDPRVAVAKTPTPYGSWTSFRGGYNARNRLLLEAKWWWVNDWRGTKWFNETYPAQRIPTQFELAWWDEQRLTRFAESVNMEHPQILIKDGQNSGNVGWSWEVFL
jgi:hypothetical protein